MVVTFMKDRLFLLVENKFFSKFICNRVNPGQQLLCYKLICAYTVKSKSTQL